MRAECSGCHDPPRTCPGRRLSAGYLVAYYWTRIISRLPNSWGGGQRPLPCSLALCFCTSWVPGPLNPCASMAIARSSSPFWEHGPGQAAGWPSSVHGPPNTAPCRRDMHDLITRTISFAVGVTVGVRFKKKTGAAGSLGRARLARPS